MPLGSLTVRLKQEGDALAARGDYEGAAVKYQQAANQAPTDPSLRFALGTALSHLGRREETVEQFRFVVQNARPDSQEYRGAQRWLIAAGEVSPDVSFAPPAPVPSVPPSASAPPLPAALTKPPGKVRGRTELRDLEGRDVNLALVGDDGIGAELSLDLTGKVGRPFEFEKVPPGKYRLVVEDRETSDHLWDVPVTVEPGKEVVVDLTPANRK